MKIISNAAAAAVIAGAILAAPTAAVASTGCTSGAEGITIDGSSGTVIGECHQTLPARMAPDRPRRICGNWYTSSRKTRTVYGCRTATLRQAGAL